MGLIPKDQLIDYFGSNEKASSEMAKYPHYEETLLHHLVESSHLSQPRAISPSLKTQVDYSQGPSPVWDIDNYYNLGDYATKISEICSAPNLKVTLHLSLSSGVTTATSVNGGALSYGEGTAYSTTSTKIFSVENGAVLMCCRVDIVLAL